MINLSRHIENLLLENDCVIVPGFGGFVAYHTPASWSGKEETFLPPCRVIGFNPQLTINDGVLVQSYMKAYDTNFSNATRIIGQEVDKLTGILQEEGKVELPNIGEIRYSINNSYTFRPYNDKLISPSLYGLGTFRMTELCNLKKAPEKVAGMSVSRSKSPKHYEIRINRSWVRNSVAAAVAVLLFFSFSTPLKNTHVPQENYAQLLPADLFRKIEKESLLTSIAGDKEMSVSAKEDIAEEITETVEAAAPMVALPETMASESVEASKRIYHIIVASVTSEDDAEQIAKEWRANGHSETQIIARDGRIRVSIQSYADRAEGERQMMNLRQNDMYKNTWLLPVR